MRTADSRRTAGGRRTEDGRRAGGGRTADGGSMVHGRWAADGVVPTSIANISQMHIHTYSQFGSDRSAAEGQQFWNSSPPSLLAAITSRLAWRRSWVLGGISVRKLEDQTTKLSQDACQRSVCGPWQTMGGGRPAGAELGQRRPASRRWPASGGWKRVHGQQGGRWPGSLFGKGHRLNGLLLTFHGCSQTR